MMLKRWSLLAGLLCVALLSWWAGCSNPNLAGGKLHFDQAGRLADPAERAARYERARDTFIQAMRELPQSGEARLWLGKTYAELGQTDSAAKYFDLAVQLEPVLKTDAQNARDHYWSVMTNLGQASAKGAQEAKTAGDEARADSLYHQALSELRKSMVYSPLKHQSYNLSGIVYFNLEQPDSAIPMFRKSYELSRNADEVGERGKVEKQFLGILERQGDRAYQSGENLKASGDTTAARTSYLRAQQYYQEAFQIRPEDSRLNYMLGVCAYQLSEVSKDPQEKQKLLGEAADRYQTVLKENPADVDVLFNLALLLREVNRLEEAKDMARRLVDLNPKDGVYHDLLAGIEGAGPSGDRAALTQGIVFARVLKSGDEVEPAQAAAKAQGGSPAKKRLLENGPPEQVLVYRETSGKEFEGWFYWGNGVGFIFSGGSEVAQRRFAPVGALVLRDVAIEDKVTSKVVKGTVSNEKNRKYGYVRVQLEALDESGEKLGEVSSAVEGLDPKRQWNFEIPLDGDLAKAAEVKPVEDRGVLGF